MYTRSHVYSISTGPAIEQIEIVRTSLLFDQHMNRRIVLCELCERLSEWLEMACPADREADPIGGRAELLPHD